MREVPVQRESDRWHPEEGEAGVPIADLVPKHGISRATYSTWRSKYAGTSVAELKRLKELAAENVTLNRMYGELALENAAIKDVLSRTCVTPAARRQAIKVWTTWASALGPSRLPRGRIGTGGVVCPAGGRHHAGRGSDRGPPASGRGQSPVGVLEVL